MYVVEVIVSPPYETPVCLRERERERERERHSFYANLCLASLQQKRLSGPLIWCFVSLSAQESSSFGGVPSIHTHAHR